MKYWTEALVKNFEGQLSKLHLFIAYDTRSLWGKKSIAMAQHPRKRKAGAVDTTVSHNDARPAKVGRDTSNIDHDEISTGQRFGEDTEFLPLNQLSQVVGADEDDAQATDVIQGSQEEDGSSLSSNILYGRSDSAHLSRKKV